MVSSKFCFSSFLVFVLFKFVRADEYFQILSDGKRNSFQILFNRVETIRALNSWRSAQNGTRFYRQNRPFLFYHQVMCVFKAVKTCRTGYERKSPPTFILKRTVLSISHIQLRVVKKVTMTATLHVVQSPNGTNLFLICTSVNVFVFLLRLQIEFGTCVYVLCFQVIDQIMWRN